jgi:hypothetical protein
MLGSCTAITAMPRQWRQQRHKSVVPGMGLEGAEPGLALSPFGTLPGCRLSLLRAQSNAEARMSAFFTSSPSTASV